MPFIAFITALIFTLLFSPGDEARYDYDKAGNISSLAIDTFDKRGEPQAPPIYEEISYLPGSVIKQRNMTSFEHDALGNRVRKHTMRQSEQITYRYDSIGQLCEVDTTKQRRFYYSYDAFGRRIKKRGVIINSHDKREALIQETDFIWDGDVLLHEVKTHYKAAWHWKSDEEEAAASHEERIESITKRQWEFHPASFEPLYQIEEVQIEELEENLKRTYLCVNDPVGNPRELITAQGNIAWQAHYQAWGKVEITHPSETHQTDCPIRYQGQYYDDETGLHYNRFRYYDPEHGRFISSDPIGLLGGLNGYVYAPNPTGWVDPWGLSRRGEACKGDDNGNQNQNWIEWSKFADDIVGQVKQRVRRSLRGEAGKGKHMGQHGKWQKDAASELDNVAKKMENEDIVLPEIIKRIRMGADRLRNQAKGTNHSV